MRNQEDHQIQSGLRTEQGKFDLEAQFPSDPSRLFARRSVDSKQSAGESITRPSVSYLQDAWLRLKKKKIALAAAVYIALLALIAFSVPPFIPFKYDEQEVWNALSRPSMGKSAYVSSEESIRFEELRSEVKTDDDVFVPPKDPENLRLLGEALTVGVNLGWDRVQGAKTYKVYRSIREDSLGIPIVEVPSTKLSYVDRSALVGDESYYYRVVAANAFGDSEGKALLLVRPKLTLSLGDAQKIQSQVKVGETIMTKPHYLGTDYLGRDTLARLLVGAQISLSIGLIAPFFYVLFGLIFGAVSGYFGGLIDNIMMRVADLITTVPELLVVIMLQVVMGSGPVTLIIAMVISLWARTAITIRGEVLRLREMEFVHSAKVLGTPTHKIIARHILPNVMGTVIVLYSLAIPQAIFTEAFMSFIGLGIAPPTPSWGTITREGAKVFLTYPLQLLFPALMMSVTMLAFNLLGDGLRDVLDPKLRGAK